MGVPAEAQRSGFGGERRRKGVNGAFRPKGGNEVHGLFDDVGMPGGQGVIRGGAKPVATPNETSRFTKGDALRGCHLSSREERWQRKTRQRTHGSLETPSLCGYRLCLDESVPDEFASVPSPNSNQRRCSRALSHVLTKERFRSTPMKLICGKAFSSTGFPPLRAYCARRWCAATP